MTGMDSRVPTSPGRPEAIRECFCRECGLIAPSWFHKDFILYGDGFRCIWCSFSHRPDLVSSPKPTNWGYVE